MYNKKNSNEILKDKKLSPAQRIALREIVQLSDREQGCNAKNETLAKDLNIGVSTIKSAIKLGVIMDVIFVSSDGNNRIIELINPSWKWSKNNHLVDEIQPLSSQKTTTKWSKPDHLVDEIQPPIIGRIRTEKERNKKVKGTSTENSFSILKTDHEELKKYLLVKHRKDLVNLLPTGTAEEIAEEFAKYWVGEGRNFTNTAKQRNWVKNSLPQWADIEKPKNESSGVAKIAKEAWKRDLPENELKLISKKAIGENWNDQELREFMIFTKRNIPFPHGVNTWNVFQTHFENLKNQVA